MPNGKTLAIKVLVLLYVQASERDDYKALQTYGNWLAMYLEDEEKSPCTY